MAGSFTQSDDREHASYFAEQKLESNVEFWRRFEAKPDVDGKRVLDFGCGHGALSLELASSGALVVGIDLDESRIDWARRNAGDAVEFLCADVAELSGEFDFIVSKDTFEHIGDIVGVLGELRRLLAPTGQIWAGFSPLYNSPWGDHGRTGVRIPWAHVVLPDRLLFSIASRHRNTVVKSLADLELNGMTPRDFRRCVADSRLYIESIKYNQGDRRLLPVLDRLRRISVLEPMATVSIYTVLSRRFG